MDLFSSLLAENIVCFSEPVDDESANLIVAQILYLEGVVRVIKLGTSAFMIALTSASL